MRKNICKMVDEPFRILRSPRRRRVAFRIGEDGGIEILAPPRVPELLLKRLLADNAGAIERLKRRSQLRRPVSFEEGKKFYLTGELYPLHLSCRVRLFDGEKFIVPAGTPEEIKASFELLYKELALSVFRRRLTPLAEAMQLAPSKIRVGGASGRWGSCNSRREIAFSWKLVQCPPPLIDYVIVHELAHLREMNHSAAFWAIVQNAMPDMELRRTALRTFSRKLPCW